jgi:hypothetical protein
MSAITRTFAKPPFIGLLAFVIVFLTQGLGHTVMIMMEKLFGHEYVFHSAVVMGLFGSWLLWYGMKHNSEVAATWYGFFAGTFLWTGWVEFSFVAYARHLGVEPLMQGGEIVTLPEYLVMSSSLGILMATLVYFLFNKETKCNFFHWFQRNMGMSTGKPNRNHERNFAGITALETIYVIWFFYLALLIIYDEAILGDRHPIVYGLFFANLIWSVYLLQRLVKFWKVTTAIRYAIPTAIIAWNNVELLGRWDFFTEIWVHPEEYWLEMSLVFGAVVVITVVSMLTPQNAKAKQEQQARA